jgi:hypothetical protein
METQGSLHAHNSTPVVPILSQMNPVHTLLFHNFKICFIIVTCIPIARQRLGIHMPAVNTPQQ